MLVIISGTQEVCFSNNVNNGLPALTCACNQSSINKYIQGCW